MTALGASPEGIADRLRERILTRELPPGAPLVQAELAARFGVSRIPLREALRTLAAEGLIRTHAGLGTFVTELAPSEIVELYEIRLSLEPALAESIVENASLRSVGALRGLVEQMDAALGRDDQHRYSLLNYSFHVRMYDLADTKHRGRLIRQVLNLTEPYSRVYLYLLHGVNRAQREHQEMLDAIGARDAETLRHRIEQHLAGARDALARFASSHAEVGPGGSADVGGAG